MAKPFEERLRSSVVDILAWLLRAERNERHAGVDEVSMSARATSVRRAVSTRTLRYAPRSSARRPGRSTLTATLRRRCAATPPSAPSHTSRRGDEEWHSRRLKQPLSRRRVARELPRYSNSGNPRTHKAKGHRTKQVESPQAGLQIERTLRAKKTERENRNRCVELIEQRVIPITIAVYVSDHAPLRITRIVASPFRSARTRKHDHNTTRESD